jgi:hypothetical protein
MSAYVPAVAPQTRQQINADALAIIAQMYPDLLETPAPFPVLDFFDRLKDDFGLDPGVEPLGDGVEGMTWPDGRVLVSEETYRDAFRGVGRARFTIPHEGYHGIRHRHQIRHCLVHKGQLVLYRQQQLEAFRNPEWQANEFAAAVLMPEPAVRILVNGCAAHLRVSRMMQVFQVSRQAAEIRLRKLGICK